MKTAVRINGVIVEQNFNKIEESAVLIDKLLDAINNDNINTVEDVMLYLYRLKENMSTRYMWHHKKLRQLLRERNLRLCDLAEQTSLSMSMLSQKINCYKRWNEKDKDEILRVLGLKYTKQLDKELFESQENSK